MTVIAGIYSRHCGCSIDETERSLLSEAISRNAADKVVSYADSRVFIAKVDIGAYGERAFLVDPSDSCSVLAGEPLLSIKGDGSYHGRNEDLLLLHRTWLHDDWSLLQNSEGVFCGVHYQVSKSKLVLISDKLCIRPVYYWIGEKYVVFSTALRILETLPMVPKIMDLRAVAEIACLGLPLGVRTQYANVSMLRGSEILVFKDSTVTRTQYYHWDCFPALKTPQDDLLKHVYDKFNQAVKRRVRNDTTTISFLSGGLDSRCIVSALRSLGIKVNSFNFSPQRSQDQFLAALFADRVGCCHAEVPYIMGKSLSYHISNALRMSEGCTIPPERPKLVWSGDGGSVGLGHVYLNQQIVDSMRAGRIDSAIEAFLEMHHARLPNRLFRYDTRRLLQGVLEEGIREELNDIHSSDPGRSFHLFLLLNDQRRHFFSHFEEIDLHRIEFQLPFFDGELLLSILLNPIDLCLSHGLYNEWVKLFPPSVNSIPWQSYPGHKPSSVPMPDGLSYQWDSKPRSFQKKWCDLKEAASMLSATDFPGEIIPRCRFLLPVAIYGLGLRDYNYVITISKVFHKYWRKCGGAYTFN